MLIALLLAVSSAPAPAPCGGIVDSVKTMLVQIGGSSRLDELAAREGVGQANVICALKMVIAQHAAEHASEGHGHGDTHTRAIEHAQKWLARSGAGQ